MMSPCQIELFGQHMINNTTRSGITRTTTNDCMWAKWGGVAGGSFKGCCAIDSPGNTSP